MASRSAHNGQVQQSNAHDNEFVGILATGDNCLITMNTANSNGFGIMTAPGVTDGNKCTVSYNTANDNRFVGIDAGVTFGLGTGHLITQNVARDNGTIEFGEVDFAINCPSTVNPQTTPPTAFPMSYLLNGTGCHTVNNQ